jgi:hypothetical protein
MVHETGMHQVKNVGSSNVDVIEIEVRGAATK